MSAADVPTTELTRISRAGFGVLALGLLVIAFFHEVMLEGKTFSSPDAQAPAGLWPRQCRGAGARRASTAWRRPRGPPP